MYGDPLSQMNSSQMQCLMTTTSVWFTRVLDNVLLTFVSFKRTTVIINYQQAVLSSMFKYINCQLLSGSAGCITNGHSLPAFLSLVLCTAAMISDHFYSLCIHVGPMKSACCPVLHNVIWGVLMNLFSLLAHFNWSLCFPLFLHLLFLSVTSGFISILKVSGSQGN